MDPQIFLWQKYGGVSQLFVELMRYAREWNEPEIVCPLVFTENVHLKNIGLSPRNIFTVLSMFNFRGIGRVKNILKSVSIKKTLKLLKYRDFDVFFPSYYDTYFLDHLHGKPFVVVVHDMIHEIFPNYFLNDYVTVPNKKLLIEKANRIITNSYYTKQDILRIYPHIPASKIVPVHHAQSIENPEIATPVELPEDFLLFVGNRDNYKNFSFMVKSLAKLLTRSGSMYLVCAGGGAFTTDERKLLEDLTIAKKVIQINFRDNELPYIYQKAKVFIFPSLYEGFGIPTLEAMKCGCPVILANGSCFPEIAGDAAVYFDPYNSESLNEAVNIIFNEKNVRDEMIARGYKKVAEYSWEKTAKGYFKAIREIDNYN